MYYSVHKVTNNNATKQMFQLCVCGMCHVIISSTLYAVAQLTVTATVTVTVAVTETGRHRNRNTQHNAHTRSAHDTYTMAEGRMNRPTSNNNNNKYDDNNKQRIFTDTDTDTRTSLALTRA